MEISNQKMPLQKSKMDTNPETKYLRLHYIFVVALIAYALNFIMHIYSMYISDFSAGVFANYIVILLIVVPSLFFYTYQSLQMLRSTHSGDLIRTMQYVRVLVVLFVALYAVVVVISSLGYLGMVPRWLTPAFCSGRAQYITHSPVRSQVNLSPMGILKTNRSLPAYWPPLPPGYFDLCYK